MEANRERDLTEFKQFIEKYRKVSPHGSHQYTPGIGKHICDLVSCSPDGLVAICRENTELPTVATIYNWLKDVPEFRDNYIQARRLKIEVLIDYLLEVMHEPCVPSATLKINTIKWLATKLCPKLYGERIEIEEVSSSLSDLQQKIKEIRDVYGKEY